MAEIPLVSLVSTLTLDNRQVLTALREVEAARTKALSGDNSDALERALQGLATAAKEANARLNPLAKQAQLTLREMQNLANAVKAGAAEIQSSLQRYRELEAILKGQVAVLDKAGAGYLGIAKDMKAAGEEGKRLESLNKSLTASYKTDDLTRYGRGLLDIVQAQKAGVTSQTQAISQLKSYQSALAQQTGALEKNSAEYKSVIKAMGDTGTAIRKLEADADKLSASFRSDELSRYAGEFKQIDAAVKSGTDGFENASTRVQKLSAELKEQQGALTNTGREFDQFSRLLKEAAAQQERYQAAAEQAARANDASQIRTYGTELKQLEGTLRNTTAELGRLDSQQRALKYDSGAVSQYRGEQERLSGSFDGLGRGLEGLRGKLQDYARGLSEGSSEHKELVRVMDATERATQTLTREQERAAQAYRGAEIEQFTARLRDVDRAQRDNLSSTEQAARAVQQIQTEFREYAAALGIAERELGTFARSQLDAGRSADTFAGAQERAARAFDASALRSFVSELQGAAQAYEKGETGAEGFTRAVSDSQGRLREYGSTLNQNSREFADFNKLLDISERALTEVGTTAERASRAFDAGPVRVYSTELKDLQSTGRELGTAFSGIEGELNRLDTSLRNSGQAANLSVRELTALQNVERELEGATTRLVAEQSKLEAAFRVDALKTFRSDLEQIVTANKNGVTSFDQTARAVDALQGRMREFATGSQLSANEQRNLATVMGQVESAATRLATAQQRAQDSFQAENVRQQVAALNDLKLALEKGDISQEQFGVSARGIGTALEQSRSGLDNSTRAYANYTTGLTRVESSLAQAEGRVRTFGVASGVTAGVSDQLQNVLYRLGPAGEAMGVAMFSASAGMTGASLSAKTLNIALTVGVVGAIIGAAVAAKALFDTAKQLDTGMTDVGKSTGFTREELLGLTKELQQVSLATGTPTKDLLALAAVAGQMGITGVDNVVAFTKALDILTVTTDIIGSEGAQQLASFINITKEANVSTAASAALVTNVLVGLGNSVAGGEAKILAMAQRLGVLKSAASLSQTDILGLAGGFVDLGLTAERAEISVTSTFTEISKAASQGGEKLEVFAKASGLTATEFQKLAKESPVDAFLALVGGLREAQDAGQDLNPVLDQIAGNNNTLRNVLLTLVGGYDNLNKAVVTAREESVRMSAAQDELANRMASLDGISDRIARTFGLLKNELALRLIPTFSGALTGVLDFSRALAGLEPDARAVGTFATKSGSAIGQFAAALVTGENQSNTFAAGVGAAFGDTYKVVDSAVGIVRTSILTIFGGALSAGVDAVKSFTTNIAQNLGGSSSAIGTIFSNVGQIVQNTVQFIGETLGRIPTFYSAMITASGELSNSVSRVFIGIGDVLKGFGFILYGSVVEPFVNMLAPIRAAATNVLLTVQNFIVGAAQRFEPLLNFLGKVGIDIAGFLTDTTEQAVSKITGFLSKGVSEYQGAGALYTGTNESIKQGFELIGLGVSGAANAVGDGTNAMTRALQSTEETLGSSVKAGDELAATNTKLGQDSEAAGAGVAVLGDESEGATGGVVDLGAAAEETGRTVGEMAQAIVTSYREGALTARQATDSLTLELIRLRAERDNALQSGEGTTQLEKDIVAVEAALNDLNPKVVQLGANATAVVDDLNPISVAMRLIGTDSEAALKLAQESFAAAAEESAEFAVKANDAATAAAVWGAAVYTTGEAQADMRQSVIDANVQLVAQDAVLEQLANSIATEKTNELAAAQAEAARAAAEASDSWRILKETQDGYTSSTTLTVSQTNTLADVMGTVRNALQEAENAFTITGDAAKFNADKTAVYQAALETLHRAGIDPATVGLQGWVTELENASEGVRIAAEGAKNYQENLTTLRAAQDELRSNAELTADEARNLAEGLIEAAKGTGDLGEQARTVRDNLLEFADAADKSAEAAKTYKENLEATRDAQEALGDASGIATEDIAGLITSLDKAAEGAGKLGADARQTQEDLRALASARELASVFDAIGESADRALADIPGLSDKAEGALQGVADASKAMSEALKDGVVTPQEGIGALGSLIDGLAEGFRDDLSPAAYAGVKALDNIADVAVKLASGDYLGAAIAAVVGLGEAIVDYFTESGREADELASKLADLTGVLEGLRDISRETENAAADALSRNLDNLVSIGELSEAEANVLQTQLDIAESYQDLDDTIIGINERRKEDLRIAYESGATQEEIDAINAHYDGLITAEVANTQALNDSILIGGAETANALGQSTEDFLGEVAKGSEQVDAIYEGAGERGQNAVEGFARRFGFAFDAAYDAIHPRSESLNDNLEADAEETSQTVERGTESQLLALTEREKTLVGFLERDNISPKAADAARELQAIFRDGDGLTAQEIAEGRERVSEALIQRERRILELIEQGKSPAEAARIANSELTETLNGISQDLADAAEDGGEVAAQGIDRGNAKTSEAFTRIKELAPEILGAFSGLAGTILEQSGAFGNAAEQGGELSAQGVGSSQQIISSSIENLKSGLATAAGGISSSVSPAILQEHQKLVDAFAQGAQASGGGIDAAERSQIEKMLAYQRSLAAEAGSITGSVSPAVIAAHAAISGSFGTGASTVNTSISSGVNLLTGAFQGGSRSLTSAIGSLYGDVTGGLSKGSSEMVSQIQRAYEAEQSKFSAESAVFERLIASAKGDEKAELIAQYNALKDEHAKRSNEYEKQIGDAASSEKGGIGDAARLVTGALGDFGSDSAESARRAYEAIRSKQEQESKLWEKLIADRERKEKEALSGSAGGIDSEFGDSTRTVTKSIGGFFGDSTDKYKSESQDFIDYVNKRRKEIIDAIREAASAAGDFNIGSPGSSGYAGEAPTISPVDFMPSIGAFAADAFAALPDYSYATGGVTAYAAATSSLLDLFGVSRSIQLNSTQERALSLNVTFSGLKDSFAAPVAGMERASSLMMSAARLQFDAAERFASAVEKMGTTTASSTLEWSRRPRRR